MRCVAVLSTILVLLAGARAQEPATPDQRDSAASDHGLVLILALDHTVEPTDSAPLKACLVHHPPLACLPFTITVRNEGKENILSSWSSCGSLPITVDFKKPDGSWEAFPRQQGNWVCESATGGFGVIWHGRSYTSRLRIADSGLGLDTAFPAISPYPPSDGTFTAGDKGYALLTLISPLVIRVHEGISGCVATDQVAEGETFGLGDPFVLEKCVRGDWMKPGIDLQSNELGLSATAAQRHDLGTARLINSD